MGKKLHLLLIVLLLVINIKAQNQEFTPYNQGTQFVSVEVDGATKRVWAAARYATGNAIVKLEAGQDPAPTVFTTFEGITPTGTPLKNYFIRDLAIDGDGNVWVGHYGYGSNNVVGGVEKIRPDLSLKHYYAYDAGGGLQTRKVRSIIVDKNKKVWAAQYNHRLIGTPPGAGANTITIWPGTLAFKSRTSFDFNVKGNTYRCASQPAELPYPRDAFGDFMPDTALRNFQALSSDDTEVWASHWAYETKDDDCYSTHENLPARILRYYLNGTYRSSFTAGDMGFAVTNSAPAGDLITNICRNNGLGTWVTSSVNNDGFSVYKNETWIHISPADFPNILEPGTGFNANAMWKDKNGRVYMGTNKGLIVYNGGEVNVESSYIRYTNQLSSAGLDNVVYDDTMVSENIFGGCTDSNDTRINWIATDDGIMKLVKHEEIELLHIEDHTDNNSVKNIFGQLKYEYEEEDKIPMIAADGSKATIFKIYTDDPEGYYASTPIYKLILGYDPPSFDTDVTTSEYVAQFGKFILKPLNSYPNSPTSAADLEYVEFKYQHPTYIEENAYEVNKNYTIVDFKIVDAGMSGADLLVTQSIRISIPPILLGHGVWSNVESMNELENYLISSMNFQKFEILKAWRVDADAAEKPFKDISNIIPDYIQNLKNECSSNHFSVGKVNVIVHSRGGLYTRGYIEGLDSNYEYKDDINSLITLDTPHFGAQGANLNLDRRIAISSEIELNSYLENPIISAIRDIVIPDEGISLGKIASFTAPPKDRKHGWGSKNLVVERDSARALWLTDNPFFIRDLNSATNLAKMQGTPFHTISSEFNPCIAMPQLCGDFSNNDSGLINKFIIHLYKFLLMKTNNYFPNGINSITEKLYHGESNDLIVPLISMQGGLGGTRFNSNFPPDFGINHTGILGAIAVQKSPDVHLRIKNLLKSNVYDQTENGQFTMEGIPYSEDNERTYNFLSDVLNPSYRSSDVLFNSRVLINRVPIIFDNKTEGDVLNFNIYQDNVDRIMVTYEGGNDSDNFGYEIKTQNLAFENPFTYSIPEGYSGKLTITAYGFKEGIIGYAKNIVTLDVGIPTDITLQGIHFVIAEPIILNQDNYNYIIKGMYSDGIERIINNEDVSFTIEDANVLSQVDANTVKGEVVGTSLLKAEINGFEDSILIKVIENPSLYRTILTSFYGMPNIDNTTIAVNWETLREYENATFVLETSYNTPDNFTEINQQAGNGTTEISAQFNYEDTAFGVNTLIYYRIKMIDTQGNITYSSIIEINLSTAGVGDEDLSNLNIELYPNPAKTNEVTLKLNTRFTDKNAKLELYSLQGKRLSVQTLNVIEGANSFKLKIGEGLTNGIYLVRVSTTNYIKTVKLIVEK